MNRYLIGLLAAIILVGHSGMAFTAERTVGLDVKMDCPTCPYIVKRSLQKVSGVLKVQVSYGEQRATVRFDDAKTDTTALMEATKAVGFPSAVVR
tara:strand:+ start:6352 stop:6636 length:285 start_codon:yes stop_codon:yes gene_type:complete